MWICSSMCCFLVFLGVFGCSVWILVGVGVWGVVVVGWIVGVCIWVFLVMVVKVDLSIFIDWKEVKFFLKGLSDK